MPVRKIIMIGSGRVATQLGRHLAETGNEILQVYSRRFDHAKELAEMLHAEPVDKTDQLRDDADLYIISVVDDAIAKIAGTIDFHDKIVVHTSGSVGLEIIQQASSNTGVFYPLQTFVKNKDVDFSDVPVCVEGSSTQVENVLLELGREISRDVRLINSEQRLIIHIAAVFVSNFTNFMYLMGQDVLHNADISFDILLPLIRETADKVSKSLPGDVQTGPAMRGDEGVLDNHLKMLEHDARKMEIYRQMSRYISDYFKQK